jgi:hypothetical protein
MGLCECGDELSGSCGSGYGHVMGLCECGDELSGSIKCGTFLDWMRHY